MMSAQYCGRLGELLHGWPPCICRCNQICAHINNDTAAAVGPRAAGERADGDSDDPAQLGPPSQTQRVRVKVKPERDDEGARAP